MFTNEKILETKICKKCNSTFEITDKDLEFYDKISPIFGGKKYYTPAPTLCPDCRFQRRATFRNVGKLYKRKCDATGKTIISMYSPNKEYIVYDKEYWWSDKWNAMDYGTDFDFSKSFFEQFNELVKKVPKISLSTEKLENSDYVNYTGRVKNCYLISVGAYDENCYYSNHLRYSENSMDCSHSQRLFHCYEVSESLDCYSCQYLNNSKNCNNCYYSNNLIRCENCLFCSGLRDKKYHILNKEVTKEEFERLKNDKKFINENLKNFEKLDKSLPKKENFSIGNENCVGEFILNSKNVYYGFDVTNIHDCKYVDWLFDSKNCVDVYDWGEPVEMCYECYKVGKGVTNTIFSAFCIENVNNLIYCYDCSNNCSNCFGCVGLKNKSYCILNKQYSKEEYEKLAPKIIEKMIETGEWGEFFPSYISPFGYNETTTYEYFPLDKDEALKQGFKWEDYEAPFPKVEKIIDAKMLPLDISQIPNDVLNWAIKCEITGKPFIIIPQELEFYRKHNLPIPKRHPDQRAIDRMKLRNPRKLFDRNCDKCHKGIKTSYSPNSENIVYCEECYNEEVY